MKNRIFGLVVVAILVVSSFVVGYKLGRHKSIPLPAYENTVICRTLHPGISISEVIQILGSPVGAAADYVLFEASPTGGPIKVKVDPESGKVTELICEPQEGATWTYKPTRAK